MSALATGISLVGQPACMPVDAEAAHDKVLIESGLTHKGVEKALRSFEYGGGSGEPLAGEFSGSITRLHSDAGMNALVHGSIDNALVQTGAHAACDTQGVDGLTAVQAE